ncbi:DUF433 domain-containing protein [Patescibacteria group bacterium]|nr:DUF433 domain-containing protein [Candidatus Falkowbacteria bacterium]MBU3905790.1 DUF433 domain-containing protein [Patescibacteria group bacterium]MBU4015278.1 DUF433 domain-containing protein [Patescibacteria group bacterium]MBU4025985.1 DUF433 domain-containing protein [Patescibacteria group bacterium]MBU4072887.1 DUF433 domain-containing protein [Patescibacteria group bacterium]
MLKKHKMSNGVDKTIKTTAPAGIVIKQKVRFGKPCIKGTRIAITDILNLLQSGYNIADVPKQYPGITVANAKMALRYAARVLGKEEILEINPN